MAAKFGLSTFLRGGRKPRISPVPAYDIADGDYDSEYDIDAEKRSGSFDDYRYYDDDRDEEYAHASGNDCSSSSRSSSGSHQPMLRRGSSAPRNKEANAYTHRDRRRCTRYFTLALGTVLVLFIVSLLKLSENSSKNVELGIGTPPPPPPAWENFPFLKRYYGGIRSLVAKEDNVPEFPGDEKQPLIIGDEEIEKSEKRAGGVAKPVIPEANRTFPHSDAFNPYPDFASKEFIDKSGRTTECFLDHAQDIRVPMLQAYPGAVKGMPDNIIGSYDVLGLKGDVCFERFGRLGPYGLGYSLKKGGSGAGMEGHREGMEDVWHSTPEVDYRTIKWSDVQERCEEANRARFSTSIESNSRRGVESVSGKLSADGKDHAESSSAGTTTSPSTHTPRTAFLIRTWGDYNYQPEDIMYLRALIAELAIHSRGEYHVHFLIHVKDTNKPIWADDEVYRQVLNESLPAEFQGMGSLWSEKQMSLIYPGLAETFYRDLPVHGSYRGSFMPVQHFWHQHPEYDFVWNWEMDARYTGHFYHLFTQVSEWAAAQPRKGLWERNSRFYIPDEHGTWEDFSHMSRVQTEHGTNSKNNIWQAISDGDGNSVTDWTQARPDKPVWGPEPPADEEIIDVANDPTPPHSMHSDHHEWGVGEPADLITFNPIFDPAGTTWLLADDYTGYNTSSAGPPPRRASIVATSRLSARLLSRMHREMSLARHSMFTEMWPASVALHHGLKAVYAPHPVYVDRRWPTDYFSAIFNGGRNGATGGGRLSVFSEERQHNFLGSSWYYNAGFAPNLWKRWLGYKVNNDGGEMWEVGNEGRMCLPAMLLHPIKDVRMLVFDDKRKDKVKEEMED